MTSPMLHLSANRTSSSVVIVNFLIFLAKLFLAKNKKLQKVALLKTKRDGKNLFFANMLLRTAMPDVCTDLEPMPCT